MPRRSRFGLSKGGKFGIFVLIVVSMAVAGYFIYIEMNKTKTPTTSGSSDSENTDDYDEPEEPEEPEEAEDSGSGSGVGSGAGTVSGTGSASGSGSGVGAGSGVGVGASNNYIENKNMIGSGSQFNCPGATGVFGDGTWCQFASKTDAENYCNSNSACAGYSQKYNGGAYQATTGTSPSANGEWKFFSKKPILINNGSGTGSGTGSASGSGTGSGTGPAPNLGSEPPPFTYEFNSGYIGSRQQFDCPGAKGVLNNGSWCQFKSQTDAEKYCNSNPACAGYSWQLTQTFDAPYQVTTFSDKSSIFGWNFYSKNKPAEKHDYITNLNMIGSQQEFDCPRDTKGVSNYGIWCQFASKTDAENYCNSNKACTGYSQQKSGGNYQVTTFSDKKKNDSWNFFSKK